MTVAKGSGVLLRCFLVASISNLLLSLSAQARGEGAAPTAVSVNPIHPSAPERARHATAANRSWYGWQTLLADAGTVGIFSLAISAKSDGLGYAGLATYLTAPAIIHAAHQDFRSSGWSVALRLTVPAYGGGVGLLLGHNLCSEASRRQADVSCAESGALVGMLGGILAAVALDSAVLSWETNTPRPTTPTALRLFPSLTLTPKLSTLALAGQF